MQTNPITPIEQVFSRRLSDARNIRMLSRKALSEMLGGTPSASALEKYENALITPSSEVVWKLATTLQLPIDYFFEPYALEIDTTKFDFRKQARLGAKKTESLKLLVSSMFERYVVAEREAGQTTECDLVMSNLIRTEAEARNFALAVRNRLQLGFNDVFYSPIAQLEMHGVKILEIEEDSRSEAGNLLFSGISTITEGILLIVVNKLLPSEPKRLTILHELGHLLMNIHPSIEGKQREDLCNVFANEMLITSACFTSIFGTKNDAIYFSQLTAVQRQYGISPSALMMKAKQLKVITPSRYKFFCIRMGQDAWLKQELNKSCYPDEHPSRFESLVYQLVSAGKITESKAAALLGIDAFELRNRIHYV